VREELKWIGGLKNQYAITHQEGTRQVGEQRRGVLSTFYDSLFTAASGGEQKLSRTFRESVNNKY